MKNVVLIAVAGLALGGVGVAAASQGPAERAQARATRILANRTAEPSVSCVSQRRLHGNQSLDDGGILFGRDGDQIVYVNHPSGGCPGLAGGRYLVTRTPGAQLCAGDIATVRESGASIPVGSCALGDFTPYRKPHRR